MPLPCRKQSIQSGSCDAGYKILLSKNLLVCILLSSHPFVSRLSHSVHVCLCVCAPTHLPACPPTCLFVCLFVCVCLTLCNSLTYGTGNNLLVYSILALDSVYTLNLNPRHKVLKNKIKRTAMTFRNIPSLCTRFIRNTGMSENTNVP